MLGKHTADLDQFEAASKAAEAVNELSDDVGMPDGLSAVGVSEHEIGVFAEDTMKLQRLLDGNPRKMDVEGAEEIFRRSL
jgi:alcohol dehydrogenase